MTCAKSPARAQTKKPIAKEKVMVKIDPTGRVVPPKTYPGVAKLMSASERARSIIIKSIKGLDLSGLTVLTEAATREYAVTPAIAAAAGARVYAFATDKDAEVTVNTFADMCGVRERVEVITEKRRMVVEQADIITNLGGLRPLDKAMIQMMKPGALILCMHESWEARDEDVDIKACEAAHIPVVYADEGELFNYCGALCVKLLLEAGIEIYRSRIVVVGGICKFGDIAATFLEAMGAEVVMPMGTNWLAETKDCDAVVMANLQDVMATGDGLSVPIIRLVEGGHMPQTLAHLGVKPVVEIHTLGFRAAAEYLIGGKTNVEMGKTERQKRSHKSDKRD